MSDKRQETIADIVAEMRKDIAEGTVGIWSDFGGEIARSYADRIEAAHKREANALDKAKSALASESLRNCDVGTAEEQSERYEKFCYAHRSREKGCGDCPLCDIVCCGFAWLQMPYGEGGAK